jgi:hypothetical protein
MGRIRNISIAMNGGGLQAGFNVNFKVEVSLFVEPVV